jgi:hypothetical protein
MIFSSKDVDLSDFPDITSVCYLSKNTHIITQAVQVTAENIGKLCLEFESELDYRGPTAPGFTFKAKRGTADDPADPAYLYAFVGVWIVPIWGEIHLFRNTEFVNTFSTDVPGPYDDKPSADIKTVKEMRVELGATGGHSLFEDRSNALPTNIYADRIANGNCVVCGMLHEDCSCVPKDPKTEYIPAVGDTEDKDVYVEQQFSPEAPLHPFVADGPKR